LTRQKDYITMLTASFLLVWATNDSGRRLHHHVAARVSPTAATVAEVNLKMHNMIAKSRNSGSE